MSSRRAHYHSSPSSHLLARQNYRTTPYSVFNPCTTDCCGNDGNPANAYVCRTGKTFYGLGYISNCDNKAECISGGWDPQYVASEKCPPNVYCSAFGFCGTTRDFYGDATVPQSLCSPNSGTTSKRRIAYYKGWSIGRGCKVMPQLSGFYTHINVAFALINQATFRVEPMDGVPRDVILRIPRLKAADPDFRVFLSIGGWTFNKLGLSRFTFY